ncbi:MAG: hypothetical protein ABSD92_08330 [Candidatus Bathyarchaeia archaeon]
MVNPPNIDELEIDAETIPLGYLYIHSFLRQKGFKVQLHNLFHHKTWMAVRQALNSITRASLLLNRFLHVETYPIQWLGKNGKSN